MLQQSDRHIQLSQNILYTLCLSVHCCCCTRSDIWGYSFVWLVGGGCGITGICVNPHIWTFDSCSRAGMDMSSWDWWGWRRVMTDSQTWKKLESQRCQNTGCGGWLGWARQTLEYQVTDKTNQCLPKHSNISDSILLNVKASSHSMLFLGFIKTFL